MLVIVNGSSLERQREVAMIVGARLERSQLLDAAPAEAIAERIREGRRLGVQCFLVAEIFPTWSSLRRWRRDLASVEPTSYAYRLHFEEARELQDRQLQEARCGDVGLAVPFETEAQSGAFIVEDLREPVRLAPWDARWATLFEREKSALVGALGELALQVEHVGSTAIEGVSAKPIVDIAVVVPRLEESCRFIPPLEELGFHFCDYPTNVDRYFFRKGRPRTHHVHVVEPGSSQLSEQVRFRDALRRDARLRESYVELKELLAEQHGADRALYSEAKGTFIAEVLARVTPNAAPE